MKVGDVCLITRAIKSLDIANNSRVKIVEILTYSVKVATIGEEIERTIHIPQNTFSAHGIFLQPRDTLFDHPQEIGLRRVNPVNAIVMVDIFRSLFAVTGVDVPPLSAETKYEYLPTKSMVSEVARRNHDDKDYLPWNVQPSSWPT